MAERTLPTLGLSPIEGYLDVMARPVAYIEGIPAATGTVPGIYALVRNIGTRTSGGLKGMSINVEPLAGYDCYGITGAEVCVYASTGTSTGMVKGLFVETQGLSTAISSDWYSLYVYSAPGIAPSGTSYVMRLEHNSAVATDGFICFVNSSTCPTQAMTFGPNADDTAWSYSGTPGACTGATGWIKVMIGTNTRYIPLASTVS